MAGQLRPTSVWPPMTSQCYQTDHSPPHWPAIIFPSSSPSTPNSPRLMSLGEPTSTSRKRNGHVMLKPATKTLLKLAKQELSNKPFRKAVNKASGLLIPAGRIQHFQPTLPASAKSLADERDRKRGLSPADETLNDLNKQIQNWWCKTSEPKSAVDKCDHRTGISHQWRIVKVLSGKKRTTRPTRASGSPTRPT